MVHLQPDHLDHFRPGPPWVSMQHQTKRPVSSTKAPNLRVQWYPALHLRMVVAVVVVWVVLTMILMLMLMLAVVVVVARC